MRRCLKNQVWFTIPVRAPTEAEPVHRAAFLAVARQISQRTFCQAILPAVNTDFFGSLERCDDARRRMILLLMLRQQLVKMRIAVNRVVADEQFADLVIAERDFR